MPIQRLLSRVLQAIAGSLASPPPAPPDPLSQDLKRQQLASEVAQTELRQAQAAKERQQTEESRAKTMASYVETVRKLVPAVAVAYGLLVAFLYFFGAIQFFPSGLTLGDSVIFIFIALAFGLFSFFFVGAGSLHLLPGVGHQAGAQWSGTDRRRPSEAIGWIMFSIAFPALASGCLRGLIELDAEVPQAPRLVWGHLGFACLLGIHIIRAAWRHGARTRPASAWAGVEDWMLPGIGYGLFNLFAVPWAVALARAPAMFAVGLSFVSALLLWIALSIGETKPPSQSGTPPSGRPLKTLALPLAAAGGLVAIVVTLAGLWGALAWAPWPVVLCAAALLTLAIWLPLLVATAPAPPAPPPAGAAADDSPSSEAKYRARLVSAGVFAMATLAIPLWGDLFQFDAQLSTAVFRGLGLRAENATVQLKGEALALVRTQARTSGIHLNLCAEPDGTTLVSPVHVLWHGMGKRSWLSIGHVPARRESPTPARGAEIEVASDELKVLRGTSTVCHDLPADVFFRSKSVAFDPVDAEAQAKALNRLVSGQGAFPPALSASAVQAWRLEQVIVTGHADAMPLSDNGNQALSRNRAACLASYLLDHALMPPATGASGALRPLDAYELIWSGTGSRRPAKSDCPSQGAHDALVECHAANRSATVRVILACQKLASENPGGADGTALGWATASDCRQDSPPTQAADKSGLRALSASARQALEASAARRAAAASEARSACEAATSTEHHPARKGRQP